MKIKVLALYLGIAILSVIAATVSYNQLEESVIAEFEESQRDVCRVVKSEIIGGFDLVSRVLSHLASSSQAEKILEQDVGDLVAADKRYEGSTKEGMPEGEWNEVLIEHINIQEKPLVDGFYFINPKGICLARMPWKADHVGRDYKDRPAIDQISNQQHSGLILTEQVYAVTDKAPSIALSYGLVEDGKLKIITRAIIRMDNCSARFLKELPAHCFSIINSSGLVIGDTCPDHINKDAVDVREIEDIAVTVSLEYANQTFTLRMIPDIARLNTTLSRFRLGAYLLFGALGVAIIVGIALARDITERKKAEETLLEYQNQLRSLGSQLLLVEERERERIAGLLHDDVCQILGMITMKLRSLDSSDPQPEVAEGLSDIRGMVEQTIQAVRTLMSDLRPALLYDLDLEAAVDELLAGLVKWQEDIEPVFEDDGQSKPLEDDVRTLLYRSVNELLMNIIKHAQASKAKVSMRKEGNKISIVVEDDGVGFDMSQAIKKARRRGHFGLFGVQERMKNLGGQFEIESEPGQGTRVTLLAPLNKQ